MDPQDYYGSGNDEKHRLKRKTEPESLTFGGVLSGFLMPAIFGFFLVLILAALWPIGREIFTTRTKFDRAVEKGLAEFNEQINFLFTFQWDKTSLWVYLLLGMGAAIFVRFAFRDEKII